MGNIKIPSDSRMFTGLILLATAILIVLIDVKFITWAVLGVVAFTACKEMLNLLKIDEISLYAYVVVIWFLAYFFSEPVLLVFGASVIMFSSMAYLNNIEYKRVFVLFYPLSPMLFLLSVPLEFGMGSLVWLVITVGITDTAAYYGGRAIGFTSFSAASPNKTQEGFISGLVVGTFAGTIIGLFITSFWIALFVSFLVSLSSIFGDLFESYLKRQAGVKDSGNILPGHGGILDRADGYLFGAVVLVLLLKALF